jgi:hypothetical protein
MGGVPEILRSAPIKTKAHRPQSIMLALYRIPHHRKTAIVAETTKQPAFREMTILFSITL